MSIDLDKTLFTTLREVDILSVMTETATAPLTESTASKDKRILTYHGEKQQSAVYYTVSKTNRFASILPISTTHC